MVVAKPENILGHLRYRFEEAYVLVDPEHGPVAAGHRYTDMVAELRSYTHRFDYDRFKIELVRWVS